MSSVDCSELDVTFAGAKDESCLAFIVAVRKRAFDQGKARDNDWIADFVATCLRGDALLWHMKLPKETRYDWVTLQDALVKRFPENVKEASATLAAVAHRFMMMLRRSPPASPPSPFAATSVPARARAPPSATPSASMIQRGGITVVADNDNSPPRTLYLRESPCFFSSGERSPTFMDDVASRAYQRLGAKSERLLVQLQHPREDYWNSRLPLLLGSIFTRSPTTTVSCIHLGVSYNAEKRNGVLAAIPRDHVDGRTIKGRAYADRVCVWSLAAKDEMTISFNNTILAPYVTAEGSNMTLTFYDPKMWVGASFTNMVRARLYFVPE